MPSWTASSVLRIRHEQAVASPEQPAPHITHHPITITITVTAAVNTGIMITLLCLDIGCGWTAAC